MDPADDLNNARYAAMRWNTPLSERHSDLLLERLIPSAGGSVLDLGCGWGELLLRAVARGPAASGLGVDLDEDLLARGRGLASERQLDGLVTFAPGDASRCEEDADRVLCVGASHAWGGTAEALNALRDNVRRGGRLLFGDGCWQAAPTQAAADIFGDEPTLAELLQTAIDAGWRVLHMSLADQHEWDDFELTWRAGRELWLQRNPDAPGAESLREELDGRLMEYVTTYRGVLGFAYLVLTRIS